MALVGLGALFIVGCGGGFEIAEGNLAGTIGGQSWEFGSGSVDMGDTMSGTLVSNAVGVKDCSTFGSADDGPIILINIPGEVGTHELEFNLFDLENALTMTFVPAPGENFIATEGIIEVEEITDAEVSVGVFATMDDGMNEVSGRFVVPICP